MGEQCGLACAAGYSVVPDGEHVEVLQLQRHQFSRASALSSDHHMLPIDSRDLVLLTKSSVRDRAHVYVFGDLLAVAVAVPAKT